MAETSDLMTSNEHCIASTYLRVRLQTRAAEFASMGRGEGGVLGPPPVPQHIASGTGTILDDPVFIT